MEDGWFKAFASFQDISCMFPRMTKWKTWTSHQPRNYGTEISQSIIGLNKVNRLPILLATFKWHVAEIWVFSLQFCLYLQSGLINISCIVFVFVGSPWINKGEILTDQYWYIVWHLKISGVTNESRSNIRN